VFIAERNFGRFCVAACDGRISRPCELTVACLFIIVVEFLACAAICWFVCLAAGLLGELGMKFLEGICRGTRNS